MGVNRIGKGNPAKWVQFLRFFMFALEPSIKNLNF